MSCERSRKRQRIESKAPLLSNDAVKQIMTFLSFAEHAIVRGVNKTWAQLTCTNGAWAPMPISLPRVRNRRDEQWWYPYFRFLDSVKEVKKFTCFDATALQSKDMRGLLAAGVTYWAVPQPNQTALCAVMNRHFSSPCRLIVANKAQPVLIRGFDEVHVHMTLRNKFKNVYGAANVYLHYYPSLTKLYDGKEPPHKLCDTVVLHGTVTWRHVGFGIDGELNKIWCDQDGHDEGHICQRCRCAGDRMCLQTTFTGEGVVLENYDDDDDEEGTDDEEDTEEEEDVEEDEDAEDDN